ncbi:MAG: NTP transferase domain-containing protein [Deltaproteobacteria bacterium]|nr:NTP transferase domain-containing protein [Deltaproteobacteria bacterium]
MKALVLAAGLGSRLHDLTRDLPKALVLLHDEPLLGHVLRWLRGSATIESIGVVAGFHADLVRGWLASHAPDVQLFENPEYRAGNLLTLCAARDYAQGDLLICNVDHLYHPAMRAQMITPATHITAIVDHDRTLGPDDMKVTLDGHGRLAAIHKTLATWDCGYIGATQIPAAWQAAYWQAVAQTQARHGTLSCVEWVLGELVATNVPVHVMDVSGHGWVEIDEPADLRRAADFLRQRPPRPPL